MVSLDSLIALGARSALDTLVAPSPPLLAVINLYQTAVVQTHLPK